MPSGSTPVAQPSALMQHASSLCLLSCVLGASPLGRGDAHALSHPRLNSTVSVRRLRPTTLSWALSGFQPVNLPTPAPLPAYPASLDLMVSSCLCSAPNPLRLVPASSDCNQVSDSCTDQTLGAPAVFAWRKDATNPCSIAWACVHGCGRGQQVGPGTAAGQSCLAGHACVHGGRLLGSCRSRMFIGWHCVSRDGARCRL